MAENKNCAWCNKPLPENVKVQDDFGLKFCSVTCKEKKEEDQNVDRLDSLRQDSADPYDSFYHQNI